MISVIIYLKRNSAEKKDMHNNDMKKREVRPLGVFALIMAIIYSIPIVLMFFVDNPVIKIFGFAAIPITIISYATAKMNFWKTPATNIRISYYGHMCFGLDCDEQTVREPDNLQE